MIYLFDVEIRSIISIMIVRVSVLELNSGEVELTNELNSSLNYSHK